MKGDHALDAHYDRCYTNSPHLVNDLLHSLTSTTLGLAHDQARTIAHF